MMRDLVDLIDLGRREAAIGLRALADRIEPPLRTLDQWHTVGYTTEEGIDLDPWQQALDDQDKVAVPPLPKVDFGPFEHHDLAPYLAEFDDMVQGIIRRAYEGREQVMADWLDDVGTVVPGFGAEAARQIVAERDRFLP